MVKTEAAAAIAALASFVVLLAHFLLRTHCAIPPGDAGELIAAASAFAPAHPPGYPTFIAIYHVAERYLVPDVSGLYEWICEPDGIGRPAELISAFRFNVVSCVLGAAALATLVLVFAKALLSSSVAIKERLLSVGAQALIVCRLSRNPTIVEFATSTEVFALHFFFLALLQLLHMRYVAAASRRGGADTLPSLGCAALVGGLAMTNQQTVLFHLLPLACFAVLDSVRSHGIASLRVVAAGAAAFTVGLFPYALMPTFPGAGSAPAWGGIDESWTALARHVLRADYGTLKLHSGRGTNDAEPSITARHTAFGLRLDASLHFITSSCGWFMLLCFAGSVVLSMFTLDGCGISTYVRRAACCVVFEFAAFGFLANLSVDEPVYLHVYARFWQALVFHAAAVAGMFPVLLRQAKPRFGHFSPLLGAAACAILAAAAASELLDTGAAGSRFLQALRPQLDRVQWAMGRAVLDTTPRDSMLVTSGDVWVTTLLALQHGGGRTAASTSRRDVAHVDRELFSYAWKKHELAQRYPTVLWPEELLVDGVLANAALLARDNLEGVTTGGGASTRRPRERRTSRRAIFVLECPELATEVPLLKNSFTVVGNGFLYRVLPPALIRERPECDAVRQVAAGVEAGSTLQRQRLAQRLIASIIRDSSTRRFEELNGELLSALRRAAPTDALRRSTREAMLRVRPWETHVLSLYAIAVKNDYLRAASALQECLAAGAGPSGTRASNVDDKAAATLLREGLRAIRNLLRSVCWFPFEERSDECAHAVTLVDPATHRSAVVPFLDLLDQTLSRL